MLAWPEAALHVDPLKFNKTTIDSYTVIENVQPAWLAELARWNVRTIIVQTKSPLAQALETAPAWGLWYGDSTAVVYRASTAP